MGEVHLFFLLPSTLAKRDERWNFCVHFCSSLAADIATILCPSLTISQAWTEVNCNT